MEILNNINTVVSIIAGIGSFIMFLGSWKQKKECLKINNLIEQRINTLNKISSITSDDEFHIENVKNFDNRKSIK